MANIFDEAPLDIQRDPLVKIDRQLIRLGKEIGRGAYGLVREAVFNGARVAVKEVKSDAGGAVGELHALSNLRFKGRCSDFIVCIYGYSYDPRVGSFIIMERMDGDLENYVPIHQNPKFGYVTRLREALYVILQMLYAVNMLHKHELFHWDIKPENFLFKKESGTVRIKLTDLGLACTTSKKILDHDPGLQYPARIDFSPSIPPCEGVINSTALWDPLLVRTGCADIPRDRLNDLRFRTEPPNRHSLIKTELFATLYAGLSAVRKLTATPDLLEMYKSPASKYLYCPNAIPMPIPRTQRAGFVLAPRSNEDYILLGNNSACRDIVRGCIEILNVCQTGNTDDAPGFDVVILAIALAINAIDNTF